MQDNTKVELIVGSLTQQIKRGDFGTRGRVPSVAQLARDFSVARNTVYDALGLLQASGIVVAKGGSYFANYPIMRISGAPLFDVYLKEQGLVPSTENLEGPNIIDLPEEIAVKFRQNKGIRVVHRIRVHGTTEVPYRISENFYPLELAKDYIEDMKKDPDLNVAGKIREATGIAISNIHDDILARLPESRESELLHVSRITPVIELRRHFTSEEGITVMYVLQTLVSTYFLLSYDYKHIRRKAT